VVEFGKRLRCRKPTRPMHTVFARVLNAVSRATMSLGRRRPFRRYAAVNPAESRGDAAARAPLRTKTTEAGGGGSSSKLFAKATYKNFEDMLEKEPGAILVDFYAT